MFKQILNRIFEILFKKFNMEFRKLKSRKKPNYIRAIILLILLLLVIFLWLKADFIADYLFNVK